MQNLSLQSMRAGASRLLLLQFALTIVLFIVLVYGSNRIVASSVFLGGGTCVFANLFFNKIFFSCRRTSAGKKIVQRMYLAEVTKLGISVLLFILVIKFLHGNPLAFLISYFVVQSSHWLSPLLFKEKTMGLL